MAVIASPKTGGILLTDSTWLNCPSFAMGGTTLSTISTNSNNATPVNGRTYSITFSGNDTVTDLIIGFGSSILTTHAPIDRDYIVYITENLGAVTFSSGTPCVMTLAGHPFTTGDAVQFSTTGAMYTGLSPYTSNSIPQLYFVNVQSSSTVWLYTSKANAIAGGSTGRVNTSGSQSGVHSCYHEKRSNTLTMNDITGLATNTNYIGQWFPNVTESCHPRTRLKTHKTIPVPWPDELCLKPPCPRHLLPQRLLPWTYW